MCETYTYVLYVPICVHTRLITCYNYGHLIELLETTCTMDSGLAQSSKTLHSPFMHGVSIYEDFIHMDHYKMIHTLRWAGSR